MNYCVAGPADLSRDFVDLNLSGTKALDAMEEIHGFRLLQLIDSCLHRFIKGFMISHFEALGNNFAIEIPGSLFLPLLLSLLSISFPCKVPKFLLLWSFRAARLVVASSGVLASIEIEPNSSNRSKSGIKKKKGLSDKCYRFPFSMLSAIFALHSFLDLFWYRKIEIIPFSFKSAAPVPTTKVSVKEDNIEDVESHKYLGSCLKIFLNQSISPKSKRVK
ncbi:hypothetical protein QVD17_34356 [Tagetes erecta]|uniref:Uncharacterized protein n=1 Tax=Tagetes erecta TaxID=13708 RepID=A0AAD8JXT3_TARER|nr:hypothetical protein QVD17_34356 [Tagetes erecta]